jgi:hypothetical protein
MHRHPGRSPAFPAVPSLEPPAGALRFAERLRHALRPLLADDALLEKTVLKIQHYMPSFNGDSSEQSGVFDFDRKINDIVAHFADGLTRATYLHAAVKRVTLFIHSPKTIIRSIEGVAEHFSANGLTRAAYLSAALSQPKLFHQKPATVIGNIDRVVDHYRGDGLTYDKYLRAAIAEPLLFYRKPDSIIRHVDLIADHFCRRPLNISQSPAMQRTGSAAVLEFMLKHPILFVMPENIIQPELLARAIRDDGQGFVPKVHTSRPSY